MLIGVAAMPRAALAGDIPTFAVECHSQIHARRQIRVADRQDRAEQSSNDTTQLGKPAETAIDTDAGEIYVADGYGNRRVIVFDTTAGAYRRHWGAYGKPPNDDKQPPYDPKAPVSRSNSATPCIA
jgi:hypothetical protein